MKTFFLRTNFVKEALLLSVFLGMPYLASNTNNHNVYDQIDQQVAQDFGLQNAIFDQIHTFFTVSGTRYDIHLAVAVASDTIPGSAISGYAREENISLLEMLVLQSQDSLPNSCFSVFSTEYPPDIYEQNAINHWVGCGYLLTSNDSADPHNNSTIVFPNPFIDEINVSHRIISFLKVFDATGKLVYENNRVENDYYKIQQIRLQPGIYFIQINNESMHLIIKQ